MSGTVVLVTGASRGIGSRLAAGLASQGHVVVGIARSAIDEWDLNAEAKIDRRVCDITDESAVRRLFSDIRKQYGRLDVLINNAGAFSGDLLLTASADRFMSVMRTNLAGAHTMTKEATKLMRPQGRGRVVSVTSIATSVPLVGNALYASAKSALERLMSSFALEFRGSGITFNSVGVSFVDSTGMVDALKPQVREQYEQRLLVPRALDMSEILGTIDYLCSDSAATVTGQVIALGSPI